MSASRTARRPTRTEQDVADLIRELNADAAVNGILSSCRCPPHGRRRA